MQREGIPFFDVSRDIIAIYYNIDEQTAQSKVNKMSIDTINENFDIQNNMNRAIDSLCNFADVHKYTSNTIKTLIMKESDSELYMETELGEIFTFHYRIEGTILEGLNGIHMYWCTIHKDEFLDAKQKAYLYKHMPIELQGWDTVNNDLIYIGPVLEKFGVMLEPDFINENLKEAFEKRRQIFFEKNGIHNLKSLREYLFSDNFTGSLEVCKALDPYGDIKNNEIADLLIDQISKEIEKDGIRLESLKEKITTKSEHTKTHTNKRKDIDWER